MTHRIVRAGRLSVAFAALVIALAPFRVPMQLSVASYAFALAGFVWASRRPRLAGLAIGLSLMKPHIGGAMLLWAFATRRWATAWIGTGVAAALAVIYAVRVGNRPWNVTADWIRALLRTQNRDDLITGQTNLQPFLMWLGWPHVSLQLLTAAFLFLGLLWLWIRRRHDEDFDLRFVALACLTSLLSFRHLSYNLLLAIPALAYAMSAGRAGRWVGVAALSVLIASPPSVWLHFIEPRFGTTPFAWLAEHAYRAAGISLFVYLVVAPDRAGRAPSSERQGDTI